MGSDRFGTPPSRLRAARSSRSRRASAMAFALPFRGCLAPSCALGTERGLGDESRDAGVGFWAIRPSLMWCSASRRGEGTVPRGQLADKSLPQTGERFKTSPPGERPCIVLHACSSWGSPNGALDDRDDKGQAKGTALPQRRHLLRAVVARRVRPRDV